MVTSLIVWFGGHNVTGVADTFVIVGGVASGGTVNVAEQLVVNGAQLLV
jgi:hypothetical protein